MPALPAVEFRDAGQMAPLTKAESVQYLGAVPVDIQDDGKQRLQLQARTRVYSMRDECRAYTPASTA